MKTLALAALAVTLTAGAAAAQSGQAAGGPLGEVSRRTGTDPWGTTYPPPGVWVPGVGTPGVVLDEPGTTGTIVSPDDDEDEQVVVRRVPRR